MNSNQMAAGSVAWEKEYLSAVDGISAPGELDEKIFAQARKYKPVKRENRMLSKAASGFSAVAIAVVLLHPAQYLGALTPEYRSPDKEVSDPRIRFRPKALEAQKKADQWFNLRSEVEAGNYVSLCHQWRQEKRAGTEETLPSDLAAKARQHCRILPNKP
ncbi:hypothetical protein [Microbulbifer aggregans]|uniref:hypothetical protein n=1 Tax=Microbulbifer aggregans TaxID=1769779 RepID=UPI001CFC9548|nr:hypothetical protein [Microbulbifer aggregans]